MRKKPEVEAAWSWLKTFGSEQDKARFRPVAAHVAKLEREVEQLRQEAARLKQLPLEDQKDMGGQHQRSSTFVPLPDRREPLPQRLSGMVHKGQQGSDNWLRTLNWNCLTEEAAMALVTKYRQEKNANHGTGIIGKAGEQIGSSDAHGRLIDPAAREALDDTERS